MTATEQHRAALARLYQPNATELREDIAAGLSRAIDMARVLHDRVDVDALLHQLVGLQRIAGRLREQLPEVAE